MTEHKKLIHTLIQDLPEKSLVLQLLREIESVTHLPLEPTRGRMVIHYLTDLGARRQITRRSIDATLFWERPLLTRKIRTLHETEIYRLCHEIAQMNRSGVEAHGGATLYAFLDRQLKNAPKKRAKPTRAGNLIP